ncbi:MAG: hypothetical protein A2381_13825 [Bdellovibrionales bacterium RIFOXYB1_FULL_37_110]|nr:MAG: hypothetical protein A2417_05460 [Bdellovibrionales bacterium RIFOXYC1_FULL_37_79]OFZ56939.1 MAG: hypothetical protein A2381_13825 [Bdellovibrionales bacterium RIFOXYB1_FULL_37_110]OFZ62026.1 MAG: hypothetical protein A2577_19295 [Bdellovibrionales bacterium RIFOXYD1_FULL_36_51]
MGLLKNKQNLNALKLVLYQEGADPLIFNLSKNKLLVGSFEGCDIFLKDLHVSHYHAIIFVNEDGGKFLDLESLNGVILNGTRIKESYFGVGDIIKIGNFELHVEEYFASEALQNLDRNISRYKTAIETYIPTQKPSADLVLVDGEFCDIVFSQPMNDPVTQIPLRPNSLDFSDYVDTDENKILYPLFKKSDRLAIQVTILSSGHVLNIEYLNLKDGSYYVSNKKANRRTIKIETLNSTTKLPFIDIKGTDIEIHPIKDFSMSNFRQNIDLSTKEPFKLTQNDILSFYSNTVQIIVQLVEAPPEIKKVPFFDYDKQMGKRSGIIFGIYIALWLILTFVININDIKREPVKNIAVVYRPAIRSELTSEQKSSGEETIKPENKGVEKNLRPDDPIKQAKQGPKTPAEKQSAAKQETAAKTETKNIKQIKTYNFDMANNLSSMLNSNTNVENVKVNQNNKAIASEGFSNSVSDSSDLKSRKTGDTGNLGSGLKGKFSTSSGAQGLGSKQGIDTTYVDPKTVVLGSMDPELIRKILQEYLPQFQHCYQQELMRNDAVKGVVRLDFRINKDGAVSNVSMSAKNAQFSSRGVGCITQVMNMISFPQPKGGGVVDVTQPLNFFSEKISGR